jgi:hypothetical protein
MQIFKGLQANWVLATLLATSVLVDAHPGNDLGKHQKPIVRKEW